MAAGKHVEIMSEVSGLAASLALQILSPLSWTPPTGASTEQSPPDSSVTDGPARPAKPLEAQTPHQPQPPKKNKNLHGREEGVRIA